MSVNNNISIIESIHNVIYIPTDHIPYCTLRVPCFSVILTTFAFSTHSHFSAESCALIEYKTYLQYLKLLNMPNSPFFKDIIVMFHS